MCFDAEMGKKNGCLNRCGYCCQWLRFQYPNTERHKEFLIARGFKIEENGENINALLFKPCPHLRQSGQKAVCLIYDKRPQACKDAVCSRSSFSNRLKP